MYFFKEKAPSALISNFGTSKVVELGLTMYWNLHLLFEALND